MRVWDKGVSHGVKHMTASHKILGWTEEVTACDCCGKSGLKGTFGVELIDGGEVLNYGSTCVTRNTGIKNPQAAADAAARDRLQAAVIEARQSDAYRAKVARFAQRDAAKIEIGRASADYVRGACDAFNSVCLEIARKHGVHAGTVALRA